MKNALEWNNNYSSSYSIKSGIRQEAILSRFTVFM